MSRQLLAVAYAAVLAFGSPVPDPDPQISLPPLIPSIPGVTEPLALNAPPLPSPPFVGSNIKPKKIGYFWTGAGDNIHAGKESHLVVVAQY